MATHSQGSQTQILFEPGASPHTFDGSSEIYEYLQHDIREHQRLIGGRGIRGTRSRFATRVRQGTTFIYGSIEMYMSAGDLVTLLPKMIGDAESPSGTFSVAEDLPYFGILMDLDYNTLEIKDCKVDQWMVRSQAPQFQEEGEPDMVYLTLQIIGSTAVKGTSWPVSPPSFGATDAYDPYAFHDCDANVIIGGGTRAIEEFVIVGNNFLYPKYVNSLTPHSMIPRDRQIAFTARVPWNSDNNALYPLSMDGAAASIKFVNGNCSSWFKFVSLHVLNQSPAPARGKQQVDLLLQGICLATGTTAATREIQVINDSTP